MSSLLFVSATREEARYLPSEASVLITGVGLVNAATVLATYLADPTHPRPERVVNIGTAGALREGLHGVFEVGEVYQHDISQAALEAMTGREFSNALHLQAATTLPQACLASGDSFINTSARRTELAQRADLVDMEGYAVARIAQAWELPVTLLKQVSDKANEESTQLWPQVVDAGARQLHAALVAQGWL